MMILSYPCFAFGVIERTDTFVLQPEQIKGRMMENPTPEIHLRTAIYLCFWLKHAPIRVRIVAYLTKPYVIF